jgi:hypothetical protein
VKGRIAMMIVDMRRMIIRKDGKFWESFGNEMEREKMNWEEKLEGIAEIMCIMGYSSTDD